MLIDDEVEVAEGDLFVWLHLLCVITKVEDNAHLKHNGSVSERPIPRTPTVRKNSSGNTL
jgi:hypothetical protein